MKEKKVLTTLKEVQDWVHKMQSSKDSFLYRGHGSDDWLLTSTYTRNEFKEELEREKFNNKSLPIKKLNFENFEFLINYFKEKNNLLKKELEKTSDLYLLGKMQHYGKYTPLIDFTKDILIALWFGASHFLKNNLSKEEAKNFKIFYYKIIDSKIKKEIDFDNITFEEINFFEFKTHETFGRTISQKSIFAFDTLNLHSNNEFSSVLIDKKISFEIILWLNQLGINANYLFPDEEGLFDYFDFSSSEGLLLEGIKQFYKKNYIESIDKYDQVIQLNPNFYQAYYNWGVSLDKLNKDEEAIIKYQKAIELNPNFYQAYHNWGVSLDKLNKDEEAIIKYQKAIELNPKYYQAYYNWGVSLDKLNKDEEAIIKYQKAIELNPKYYQAYHNWGVSLNKLNKDEEVKEKFQKAIELNPKYYQAYYNWGVSLGELNKDEEAIIKYQKAIELNPNFYQAYHNWGVSLNKLNKDEEAKEKFQKAIAIEKKSIY